MGDNAGDILKVKQLGKKNLLSGLIIVNMLKKKKDIREDLIPFHTSGTLFSVPSDASGELHMRERDPKTQTSVDKKQPVVSEWRRSSFLVGKRFRMFRGRPEGPKPQRQRPHGAPTHCSQLPKVFWT